MAREIITFSRRTDPAFFMDWLMERIDRGECFVPNPFSGRPYRVGLRPEEVLLFNFWTKAPHATIDGAKRLLERGYNLAYFITVTSYPQWLENRVPPLPRTESAIDTLHSMLGPHRLWWRYDPIILTENLTAGWHMENFSTLCGRVWEGRTERVIISLAHIDGPYRPARNALENACRGNGDTLAMPSYDAFIDLAESLARIARRHGIRLCVCCSPRIKEADLDRVPQEACLSSEYLEKIIPDIPRLKIAGTRRGSHDLGYAPCRCVESRDIGTRGTCPHGCVYCYANIRRNKGGLS